MEDKEKRWNVIMAIVFFLAMMGTIAFMVKQNQDAENAASPSPTTGITAEPVN